jgi:hypothetical protein
MVEHMCIMHKTQHQKNKNNKSVIKLIGIEDTSTFSVTFKKLKLLKLITLIFKN